MTALIRKDSRVGEMLERIEGSLAARRPAASPIRVEDYVKDGTYIARAELPGLDPERDIEVTVSRGTLAIHAEAATSRPGAGILSFASGGSAAASRCRPTPTNSTSTPSTHAAFSKSPFTWLARMPAQRPGSYRCSRISTSSPPEDATGPTTT